MPICVNGEIVPEELIRLQSEALRRTPEWRQMAEEMDELEFRLKLRSTAENEAILRILMAQFVARDKRPLDEEEVTAEMEATRREQPGLDESELRTRAEVGLRNARAVRELAGKVKKPKPNEIRRMYNLQRESFRTKPAVALAQIVKIVDEEHPEEEARAGIETAMEALRNGESFESVAMRISDSPEDSQVRAFHPGDMDEEFETVVFALKAGERSEIFRTAFGFYIVEARGVREGGEILPFEEIRTDIERAMTMANRQVAFARGLQRLRSEASIRRVSRAEAERIAAEASVGAASVGATSEGGTSSGGTSEGGTSSGGTSEGGTSSGGTSEGGAAAES